MFKILLIVALHVPADTIRPAYFAVAHPRPGCDTTYKGKDTILWCPYSKEQAKHFTAADTALADAKYPHLHLKKPVKSK